MDKLPYSCGIPASMLCERILSPLAKGSRGVHFVDLLWPLSPTSRNPGGFCFPQRAAGGNGIPGPLIFGLHLGWVFEIINLAYTSFRFSLLGRYREREFRGSAIRASKLQASCSPFFYLFFLRFADVEEQERLFPANLKAGRIRSG